MIDYIINKLLIKILLKIKIILIKIMSQIKIT
jgi:hypothetical protein